MELTIPLTASGYYPDKTTDDNVTNDSSKTTVYQYDNYQQEEPYSSDCVCCNNNNIDDVTSESAVENVTEESTTTSAYQYNNYEQKNQPKSYSSNCYNNTGSNDDQKQYDKKQYNKKVYYKVKDEYQQTTTDQPTTTDAPDETTKYSTTQTESYTGNDDYGSYRMEICSTVKYRTYDGFCNNLIHPYWGQALTPYARMLSPKYGDGVGSPREHGSYGHPLPCARCLSIQMAQDYSKEYPHYSHMLMQWGQFLNHDLTNKPVWSNDVGNEISCCDPNVPPHPDCYPIQIPQDDPFYSYFGKNCINFVRSKPYSGNDYVPEFREQYNDNSAFIDGSGIYGSSKSQANQLRLFDGGKLKSTKIEGYKDLLPTTKSGLCRTGNCFQAGDFRVNMFPSLASMHTLFMREHNSIVTKLQLINPHWNDEKLYHEGRKIVGGIIQHITFNEFLPIVLGRMQMSLYQLLLDRPGYYYEGYEPYLNPSIYNAFTGAAFRFGHSLVQPQFKRYYSNHAEQDWSPWLGDEYFNTSCLYQTGEMDAILLGLVDQHAQLTDPFFSKEITTRLYEPGIFGAGLDLVALNIQRGRDNGLPPYNDWREYCGLKRIKSFEELGLYLNPHSVEIFKSLYSGVDDIELFPAGISEYPLSGGIIGPTFSCIILQQFFKLKAGDRFWFENSPQSAGISAFSIEQVDEIRKSSLARIICDNTDYIETIQPKVMYTAGQRNERTYCYDYLAIPQMDLTKWKEEENQPYYI
ncbi:hypothetical protein CHUAL_011341 [Chamberlinius hualienensis]